MAFIAAHKDRRDAHGLRWGVVPICTVLSENGCKIAPSTYYAAVKAGPSKRSVSDAAMTGIIVKVHEANRSVYGAVKIWKALQRMGHEIGRDRVARLMRAAGLRGRVRGGHRTFTTRRDDLAARFPDRVDRTWDTGVPDRIWVADFTYVWTYAGFCYVSFVVDAASRRILGWKVDANMETPLVTDALEQALSLRRRTDALFAPQGLIHHSDAGVQYTSVKLTEHLTAAGMQGSIGTVGDAYDNALMESTIGLYKTELIDFDKNMTWKSRQQVETETAGWVRWYNDARLHSSIGYIPPREFENNHQQSCILEPQNH